MKDAGFDVRSTEATHSPDEDFPKMESGFVSLDPEEEKLLAEIRTDLEGMKKKEAAMEALLQELAASNKITYAAIAAHSGVSVPAAP
ncbi:hypothetical protein GL50803_0023874 [Giardia duodenalis]|uniref:Uncharacterized protein n=1 Tax=Giardia intestinalis (strain ATCC 50803 / WB clone C6) TaxID=184922 RepID=A8BMR8_GIAIC|nr:hypothetical protein GL50803_0023874 [Giardia intestinalis]KAE8304055.1 hypothetical protein GL50803_0023874 [Giardia intestinalis]|eukprot:XP_001706156.1 Hypothetical protein GL50803_23874 [Giardia lamblia ATCC 50803]